MTWQRAADHEITFGKHAGLTVDQIAETSDGLLYLVWLAGRDLKNPILRDALDTYLTHPVVKQAIEQAKKPAGQRTGQ